MQSFSHAALPGVTIYAIGLKPQRGTPQEVLVQVSPDQTIPLHEHDSDARMYIVSGSGFVLSEDSQTNGRSVSIGDCVCFERNKMHGFQASAEGLSFVSTNGGIVDEAHHNWDIKFG
jgi:quercetin dioxygenase-like cupin family protein